MCEFKIEKDKLICHDSERSIPLLDFLNYRKNFSKFALHHLMDGFIQFDFPPMKTYFSHLLQNECEPLEILSFAFFVKQLLARQKNDLIVSGYPNNSLLRIADISKTTVLGNFDSMNSTELCDFAVFPITSLSQYELELLRIHKTGYAIGVFDRNKININEIINVKHSASYQLTDSLNCIITGGNGICVELSENVKQSHRRLLEMKERVYELCLVSMPEQLNNISKLLSQIQKEMNEVIDFLRDKDLKTNVADIRYQVCSLRNAQELGTIMNMISALDFSITSDDEVQI